MLWAEAKQPGDNEKGKGNAKGQGKPADKNKEDDDKEPRQEPHPTEPKGKAKGKGKEQGKRDYEYEYGNWRGQYPHYSDGWHDNNWESSGRALSSGWQDWSRYWRLDSCKEYTDKVQDDPSGPSQAGPSGPKDKSNNYQMAPRADRKLEPSSSGIRRNTRKDHAQNLPSPSGLKVGPSGPYKSWPTSTQKCKYSPSGSQAGPSGPHNTSHKQHDHKHETKKDPPIQPEVPHRRRRGTKIIGRGI